MNYLHRWTKHKMRKPYEKGVRGPHSDESWNSLLRRAAIALLVCREEHDIKVQWHASADYKLGPLHGHDPAQLNAYAIRFNGIEEAAGELFELTRGGRLDYQASWHCDTKGKPYDLAVCVVLLLAEEEIALDVVRAGDGETWAIARAVIDTMKKQTQAYDEKEQVQ